jgi:uncharacterized protein (TIGR02611 family)
MAQTRAERMRARLAEQRAAHRRRGRFHRAAVVVAGATVTTGGVAMLVLPGPALLVIPVGLAMLALEFAWAERLLDRAIAHADAAQRKAAQTTTLQRVLAATATLVAAVAAVSVALLWDVPLLPV